MNLAGDLWRISLVGANYLELLHPAAVNGLAHIDVAFGVHRHRVRVHEFAYLVARTSEAAEYVPAGSVTTSICSRFH